MVSGEFILVLIITLLNISLWAVFFVKLKRNLSPQRILTDIKQEVEKLLIEINRTVAEDITLIDDRSKKMNEIIDECEKKMALYYAQEHSKDRESDVLQRLTTPKKSTTKAQSLASKYQVTSVHQDISNDDDSVQLSIDFETHRVNEKARLLEEQTQENTNLPEIKTVQNSPITEVPFKNRVLQLASNDLSVEMIAQKLGCTETEVQIILDLYL